MKTRDEAPIGRDMYIVRTGEWRFRKPVFSTEKCTGCGICFIFCPTHSIYEAEKGYDANLDTCKGCGICANECHVSAVTMEVERKR